MIVVVVVIIHQSGPGGFETSTLIWDPSGICTTGVGRRSYECTTPTGHWQNRDMLPTDSTRSLHHSCFVDVRILNSVRWFQVQGLCAKQQRGTGSLQKNEQQSSASRLTNHPLTRLCRFRLTAQT